MSDDRNDGASIWATTTLGVLIAINLLNYLDRYVLSAVLPYVSAEFGLADRQSGLLGGMFMITYMLASPFAGYLGDRAVRKYVIAGGIFLWSLATIATASCCVRPPVDGATPR